MYYSLALLSKYLEYLLDAVLSQDGLIDDDVDWWSWFEKISNIINNVDIGFCNTVEFIGSNNANFPSHGAPIGSSVVIVDIDGVP